jgi:sec-independent protein translocase protein TatA
MSIGCGHARRFNPLIPTEHYCSRDNASRVAPRGSRGQLEGNQAGNPAATAQLSAICESAVLSVWTAFDYPRVSCRIDYKSLGGPNFQRSHAVACDEEPMLAYFPGNIWGVLLLLLIVLLLFGNKLPALARSLGQSVVEFKKGIKELEDKSDDDPAKK